MLSDSFLYHVDKPREWLTWFGLFAVSNKYRKQIATELCLVLVDVVYLNEAGVYGNHNNTNIT